MPSHPDGLAIARARIADEKDKQTGFLDLGRLGLTELPEELFDLVHLSGLNLGHGWLDEQHEWHEADSDLSRNQVANQLAQLSRFPGLRLLSVAGTDVSDLAPLAGLTSLQSLDCSWTQVSELAPLAGLTSLQSLYCSSTQVSELAPLAGLNALQSLDCSWTQVSDLAPLAGLTSLQSLNCSYTQVSDLPNELVWLESLRHLYLFDTRITDIPAEALSPNGYISCLESLRAHLRDLAAGSERLPDVKVLVLGNGRIGKTQICRLLRGEPFDPSVESTHGILVTSAELTVTHSPDETTHSRQHDPGPRPTHEKARLHLWDFGGQDLYHGTHALFLRTRSIFVLVWTPRFEDAREYQYAGITFRNHPLAYWLDYVRHFGGTDRPVLVVQNWCDRPEEESLRPPVDDRALAVFPCRKVLHYSALKDRGRAALNEALQEAIRWLWEQAGRARIGKGRLKVKRKLEAMRDRDAKLPVVQRKHRTMTQASFHQLCTRSGGVSDPDRLLDYLHAAGVVFYQRGLFGDHIVLDQGWALDAVYAVFHREKCYRYLRQEHGRFTRTLLEALVWREYEPNEQELFLSLMTSCGIAFVHREGDREGERETEYIAPDLLPDRIQVAGEIEATWAGDEPDEELVFDLPFLHEGVMRGIISRIGREAGIRAVYWKQGLCLYEQTTRSRALIEQETSDRPISWSGRVAVRTRGGQAAELLRRLREWIVREIERSGCRDWTIQETPDPRRPALAPDAGRHRSEAPEDLLGNDLVITRPPSSAKTYCVSYAWNDESKQIVDELCRKAAERGITILRDVTGMGLGESITRFMEALGAGDRVFVILSDKYLKSPYCMTELLEVWHNCKRKPEAFRERIRVYRLPDAAMMTPRERIRCAVFWKEEFEAIDTDLRTHGASVLGTGDLRRFKLMSDFAHHVGEILELIADTLLPKDFEELVQHGFRDETLAAPSL